MKKDDDHIIGNSKVNEQCCLLKDGKLNLERYKTEKGK